MASYKGADLAVLSRLAATSDVLCTETVYRGGTRHRDARQRLLANRWYSGLPVSLAADYRRPAAAHDRDDIEVVEFDDPVSQSRHLAQRLRAAHRAGTAWRDMAVLVTRPGTEIPVLARGLGQARIPVHVPTADLALAEHPAVATLLAAARLVLAPDPGLPRHDEAWRDLLCSDLGGVSTRNLRDLERQLRMAAPDAAAVRVMSLAHVGGPAFDPVAAASVPARLHDVVAAIENLGRRVATARRLAAKVAQSRMLRFFEKHLR